MAIAAMVKVQTGKDIPEHEVMKIVLKEESNLPSAYAELIRGMLREKMHSLENIPLPHR